MTAREIEESIASASAKVYASSKGAVQDKADETELQIMRRRRWAEGQAQKEPYTSRSGRAVCLSYPAQCQAMNHFPQSATRPFSTVLNNNLQTDSSCMCANTSINSHIQRIHTHTYMHNTFT